MAAEMKLASVAVEEVVMLREVDEVRPENIPLPTDSMITVRLSDAQLQPDLESISNSTQDLNKATVEQNSHTSMAASSTSRTSSRSSSRSSQASSISNSVDWEGLERTEEQELKDDATDESTALLLARLEQENNALATDPKAGLSSKPSRGRADTRPMSVHGLKRLVNAPHTQSLRYSQIPAPAMTELEFWAALVQDYRQTVQRLPALTSNKIRGGVPPPLRGVVWPSIAGAHDLQLHQDFQRLSTEPSPYDGLIGKDVGRSFPNVDMFKDKDGEGQQMLRKVLKAFSLYDEKIGYCQGLGFVVGPLLMHMGEADAFAVLVRLMEHYDLRSCYTPDLTGLHMRIYQFQILLTNHLPTLSAHLASLNVEPLYVSQWFLSFFAVTCPLPMLLRIYDIILAEGATETLMRVALSLMQRNQKKLLAFSEFEDAMQFLLSRSLWDTYAQHADDMVQDFTSLTNLVSRESLQTLEAEFKKSQVAAAPSPLKSAAASLLGRFWAGSSHQASKSTLSLKIPGDTITVSTLRKTSSGNSLTSTMTSIETTSSEASTALTEVSDASRVKSEVISLAPSDISSANMASSSDRGLHSQIEDLLTALGKLQHQQMELARELQHEREEREEERTLATSLLRQLRKQREDQRPSIREEDAAKTDDDIEQLINKASEHFSPTASRRISIIQTKHQLRDSAAEWKEKHEVEASRCQALMRQLDERDSEHNTLREELKEARQRIQDSHKDKQRLERQVQDLRSRSSPLPDSPSDLYTPVSEKTEIELKLPAPAKGLREFRLGKPDTPRSSSLPFSKRSSSLLTQSVIAASNGDQTQSHEAVLLELVNAKTAEAIARQELEETKGKLDGLRKIISGGVLSPSPHSVDSVHILSTTPPTTTTPEPQKPVHAPSSSVGGFFSGWGKRST
ncbi:hypothetical protein LTR70_004393 [Exophiala xenobiotica]|uniref:Rab-GAP TBC domain-containing protein n=1 Tax=Lithohypha guttulata TaxID=1690604 RepID=A0ABR0JXE7_9EURO|nr:hypothetical protein LTR24_009301 [Lithohypha guttulata]KAK5320983.1 hypothetical protein LTR70_004393 [Exophiala xenobiotica]